jgi:hypothetical protein
MFGLNELLGPGCMLASYGLADDGSLRHDER